MTNDAGEITRDLPVNQRNKQKSLETDENPVTKPTVQGNI